MFSMIAIRALLVEKFNLTPNGKRSNYREFVVIIELCLTFENWNISYLHKFGSTSVKNYLFIRIDKGIEIVS